MVPGVGQAQGVGFQADGARGRWKPKASCLAHAQVAGDLANRPADAFGDSEPQMTTHSRASSTNDESVALPATTAERRHPVAATPAA
jgi:hypothetical protein